MDVDQLVDLVMYELYDLGPYIWYRAKTTTSVYIKFNDDRLGSLTIRDHKGIKKCKYRWNLVIGYNGSPVVKGRGFVRYFYSEFTVRDLIDDVKRYSNRLGGRYGLYKCGSFFK